MPPRRRISAAKPKGEVVRGAYDTLVIVQIPQERKELIQEEKRKIRQLRFLVDLTTSMLCQDTTMSLEQARVLIRNTEKAVLQMFPDKQLTFDIVLLPRFERVLRERWGVGLHEKVN